jgi:hypothetical protein
VTTTDTGGGGGGSGDFCADAKKDSKDLETSLASVYSGQSTKATLQKEVDTIIAAYTKAESQAPDQIKPDLAVFLTFMTKLKQVYASAGSDPTQALQKLEPLVHSAKLKKASLDLKNWAKANCGVQ